MSKSPTFGDLAAQAPMAETERILDQAAEADVTKTYALVSGGHDSLTALYVAHQSLDLDGVVHINTGIGVAQTRRFVRERARTLGLDYIEIGPGWRYESESYQHLVTHYGFPGAAAHRWMYANLKEKPLSRFCAAHDGPVALISGVRRHESDRRMQLDETGYRWDGDRLWVSPLIGWTGLDVRRYRRAQDLPMNPVVERLEMSGECCCGAFADRAEFRQLATWYPEVARCIRCLEAQVAASAPVHDIDEQYRRWGHANTNDRELDSYDDPDQPVLCVSCEPHQDCSGGDADE